MNSIGLIPSSRSSRRAWRQRSHWSPACFPSVGAPLAAPPRITNPDLDTTIVGTINPAHLQTNLDILEQGPLSPGLYEEAKHCLAAAGSTPRGRFSGGGSALLRRPAAIAAHRRGP